MQVKWVIVVLVNVAAMLLNVQASHSILKHRRRQSIVKRFAPSEGEPNQALLKELKQQLALEKEQRIRAQVAIVELRQSLNKMLEHRETRLKKQLLIGEDQSTSDGRSDSFLVDTVQDSIQQLVQLDKALQESKRKSLTGQPSLGDVQSSPKRTRRKEIRYRALLEDMQQEMDRYKLYERACYLRRVRGLSC